MNYRVISADNHINEPRDLFLRRLPAQYTDRAPRVMAHSAGGEGWSWDGRPPLRHFDLNASAGMPAAKAQLEGLTFDQIRPGNWDPEAHLADMETDGVDAVVVYPQEAMKAYLEADREFGLACLRAYNDWMLEEFEAFDRSRIMGLPMLPTDDGMEKLIAELDRCVAKGARAMFLPGLPSVPYHHEQYEALWEKASEQNITLTFHREAGGRQRDPSYDETNKGITNVAGLVSRYFSAIRPFTYLIFAGVFDRHPGLKIVAGEVNCGWMPFWLETLDDQMEAHDSWAGLGLSSAPSDYVGENIFVTALNDRVGFSLAKTVKDMTKAVMFSSDYPHSATLWPNSAEWLEKLTEGYTKDQRDAVAWKNAADRVYRFRD